MTSSVKGESQEHMGGSGEIQRRVRITGQVQGVGFRWWARRTARELGVRGTVRNCPDGSVEIRARGSEEMMTSFLALLQQGAPAALVHKVETFPCDEELPVDFEIVRWSR